MGTLKDAAIEYGEKIDENEFGLVSQSSVKYKNLFTKNAIKNRFKKGNVPWSKGRKLGYNKKQADKIRGRKMSEEQKQKISKALKGRKQPEGSSGVGRIWSDESRKKLSMSQMGKKNPNKGRKRNYKFSDETKLKMSISAMGRISAKKGKTFEEMYGSEKANKLKNQIRKNVITQMTKNSQAVSSIEITIKELLDKNKIQYIHQYNLDNIFIPDFFIKETNTILECDGDYWHSRKEKIVTDRRKNGYYKSKGFRVIRLNESLIKNNPLQCIKIILNPYITFFQKNFEEEEYEWTVNVNSGVSK